MADENLENQAREDQIKQQAANIGGGMVSGIPGTQPKSPENQAEGMQQGATERPGRNINRVDRQSNQLQGSRAAVDQRQQQQAGKEPAPAAETAKKGFGILAKAMLPIGSGIGGGLISYFIS